MCLCKGNEDLKDRLIKGLNYTVKTRLTGHGFDADKTLIDSLRIFKKGRLSDFLEKQEKLARYFII
jgi:hypothetical protein